jgi:hypothetical protein
MSDRRPEGYTLIGLHKLAAQNGEGLVPELYELMMEREERRLHYPNVEQFPIWDARMPGEEPDKPLGRDALTGDNVVTFDALKADKKRKA